MGRNRTAALILAFILAGGASLSAQDKKGAASTEKEITIEELFLKSIEFQILREKAFSDDLETKLLALDDLEKRVSEGRIGEDITQIEFVLEYLAMEGVTRSTKESGRLVNSFPEVRRSAANLLGQLGGEAAKNALITVLLTDVEPMVKSEAAYALGVIGLNERNEVVRSLVFALEREDPTRVDNNFGYAVVLAIEKIAQKNKGISDPSAYRALIRIAQGNYIQTVKKKALQVLDKLREYQ